MRILPMIAILLLMLFRLYGTALCSTVLAELRRMEVCSVPDLVEQISPEDLTEAEKRNLDRRIRRALTNLEGEGYASREWKIRDKPVLLFKIQDHAKEHGHSQHA